MSCITSVTSLELFLKICPECKEVTIYGFHHQIPWVHDTDGVFFIRKCEKCGHEDRLDWASTDFLSGTGI